MAKLANKVAVITGATSGMALATAKLFIEEGAHVFITGRRQAQLDVALKELGPKATGIQGDVANLADLDKLFATVKASKGRVDVLFASAGIGDLSTPIEKVTEKYFDDQFNVNVRGMLFTVQKALPLMSAGGSIILNGSIAAVKGFANASVYSATKAAVRSFGRTWAAELAQRQIRVNVISPGPIDTPILDALPDDVKQGLPKMVPLGRLGRPEEIATTTLFLASGDSTFITGSEIYVDGGAAQV